MWLKCELSPHCITVYCQAGGHRPCGVRARVRGSLSSALTHLPSRLLHQPRGPRPGHNHIHLLQVSSQLTNPLSWFTLCVGDREMRCLRNKIHSNLFLTFILTNTCWIITAVMQSLHTSSSSLEFSWCVSLIFSRYFHLATFFWMFVEG